MENNYVYPPAPVNDFDLDGTATNWLGSAGTFLWNHKVDVALTALMFVPGLGQAAMATRIALTAYKAVSGGVYVARTADSLLYVGKTVNFAVRAKQHAAAGKILLPSKRLQIPLMSANKRAFVERLLYSVLGGKRAPWLANKIKPPRR